MQYGSIKKLLDRIVAESLLIRKLFYWLLDLLLLRTWHIKRALRKIAADLPCEASVLDAGSGFGQYTWRMVRLNPGWKITAMDINGEQIETCERFFRKTGRSERVTFRTGDLVELNDSFSYDLILSVDVMEHIKEDEVVFRNFFDSLKNNGILLISTPSDKGGSDTYGDNDKSFIDEHVRNGYSIRDITGKLTDAGFSGIESSYTYGKPGHLSWMMIMKYPVKMLNVSYLFFIILPFYYLIVFPVSIILNIFDLYLIHKTGTGLVVRARKVMQ